MTKLKYIGRMAWVERDMGIDGRMWDIQATNDPILLPLLHSTRMLDGLADLGIVSKMTAEASNLRFKQAKTRKEALAVPVELNEVKQAIEGGKP